MEKKRILSIVLSISGLALLGGIIWFLTTHPIFALTIVAIGAVVALFGLIWSVAELIYCYIE